MGIPRAGGGQPAHAQGYVSCAFLAFRRGLSANHQMLAIVPTMPTVAATGFTTFRAPLFAIPRLYLARLEAG